MRQGYQTRSATHGGGFRPQGLEDLEKIVQYLRETTVSGALKEDSRDEGANCAIRPLEGA